MTVTFELFGNPDPPKTPRPLVARIGIGATTVPTTSFGRTLRDMRRQRGLSQQCLADRACLDKSTISRLEAGSRAPSVHAVAALAVALDLSHGQRDRLLRAAYTDAQRARSGDAT